MSLLVTGSIGIDSVSTPAGNVENVLGGSAVYFAFAAVQFVPVRLVGRDPMRLCSSASIGVACR